MDRVVWLKRTRKRKILVECTSADFVIKQQRRGISGQRPTHLKLNSLIYLRVRFLKLSMTSASVAIVLLSTRRLWPDPDAWLSRFAFGLRDGLTFGWLWEWWSSRWLFPPFFRCCWCCWAMVLRERTDWEGRRGKRDVIKNNYRLKLSTSDHPSRRIQQTFGGGVGGSSYKTYIVQQPQNQHLLVYQIHSFQPWLLPEFPQWLPELVQ